MRVTREKRKCGRRGQLLDRIERRFEIRWQRLQVVDLLINWAAIADPDSIFEHTATEFGDAADPAFQPYWTQSWDSALAVARAFAKTDLAGVSVLDLGCGLGLPGTVAAAKGARVLMADAVSAALLFARLNSWPWRQRVRVRQVNWQRDQLDEQFDLIVGSDILYDRDDWPHLQTFLSSHLKPKGSVLLGEPGRSTGDEFLRWADSRSWRLVCESVVANGQAKPIRLIRGRPC